METVTFGPENETSTFWLTIWGISFAICILLSLIPLFVMQLTDGDFPGGIITFVLVAVWVVIGIPIAMWIPAFYRSLEYAVDLDCVRAKAGVFWKRNVTIPFAKITNVDVTQGPLQRRFGLGTIHVQTAGAGGQQGAVAELRFYGIRDTEGLKDTILSKVRGRVSAPGESGVHASRAGEGDTEILHRMLGELTAIRERLERGGSS